jgi:hypothetical protein
MWKLLVLLLISLAACNSNTTRANRGSVHAELVRLQEQTGLSLLSVRDNKIYAVVFASRSLGQAMPFLAKGSARFGAISSDGSSVAFDFCPEPGLTQPTPGQTECPAGAIYLGVSRTDGSGLRRYSNLTYPSGICWSPDNSNLVLNVSNIIAPTMRSVPTAAIERSSSRPPLQLRDCGGRRIRAL